MLNKFIFLSLMSMFFTVAHAQDGKFTFVQGDEPTPFTGTLFDPPATARILAHNKFLKEQCALVVAFELNAQEWAFNLEIDQLEITLDTERKRYEATLNLKNTEIGKLNQIIAKKPGSNALVWGIVGGFVVGAASTVAIVQAVN